MTHRDTFRSPWMPALLMCGVASLLACADRDAAEGSGSDGDVRPPFSAVPPIDPSAKRPKAVVMIMIDTLRSDHLGCYGNEEGLTPVLDEIARSSFVFTNAIATSSWTRSSVASLFTSRYPTALRCLTRQDRLTGDNLTLAEILTTRGNFYAMGVCANGNAGAGLGFAQGFHHFRVPPLEERRKYEGDPKTALKIPGDAVTRWASKMMVERTITRHKDKPVFLWAHYVDPHDPYLPHEGLLEEQEPDGRWSGSRLDLNDMGRNKHAHRPVDRDRIKYLYKAEVKYCDARIGDLLLNLRAAYGSLDDIMLIVTSDHGEGLWDHGRRGHGCDLYSEQVRVPLMIHYPGQRKGSGAVIDQPVSLVDVPATILATCQLPIPASFQGNDLTPLTRGESRGVSHDYIYTEMKLDKVNLEALRTSTHKLIRNRNLELGDPNSVSLYDLVRDPGEQHDLLSGDSIDSDTMRTLNELQEYLWRWSEQIAKSSGGFDSEKVDLLTIDFDTLRQLAAMGYISMTQYGSAVKKRDERAAKRKARKNN